MDKFDALKDKILDERYKIEEKIGSGGMADVYKGKDLLLERPVAIKVLHSNFARDAAFILRFKGEAQSAGKLSHPNIVNMYDVGCDQGYHYIVMEYVPSITLKEYIKKQGKLSIEEAVHIAIAIAHGLEHAHAMGIVHCDIKPHNILITQNGNIKVTDFGIARAINSSQTLMYSTSVLGSAHYLSPEQASGDSINGASDIYSLGVVLYEMLTGRVPYEGDSAISVALKHVREKCVPPSKYNGNIPPLLEAVILKALEKNPEERFQSISEMIHDLRASYGNRSGKKARMEQYDFATQLISPVQSLKARDVGREEKEENRETFLDIIAKIPQKLILFGAIILFIFAFLWAYFSFGNFWSNATVTVPNVVGKQVTVAQNILQDKHLKVAIDEVSNSDVPVGQVISMSPEAGAAVKEQRIIHIVISKGVSDISMPDLKGMNIEDAKNTIKSLGLNPPTIEYGFDTNRNENVVLEQSPPALSKISKDQQIIITVNKSTNEEVTVPNLEGKTIGEARTLLQNLGLNIAIDGASDDSAIISNQNPKEGEKVKRDKSISVTGTNNKEKTTKDGVLEGTVDITIPNGPKKQNLKIVLVDKNGRRVIYDSFEKPGAHIIRKVSGIGQVRVQVYINGNIVQDLFL